jgi:hypothetical protein
VALAGCAALAAAREQPAHAARMCGAASAAVTKVGSSLTPGGQLSYEAAERVAGLRSATPGLKPPGTRAKRSRSTTPLHLHLPYRSATAMRRSLRRRSWDRSRTPCPRANVKCWQYSRAGGPISRSPTRSS